MGPPRLPSSQPSTIASGKQDVHPAIQVHYSIHMQSSGPSGLYQLVQPNPASAPSELRPRQSRHVLWEGGLLLLFRGFRPLLIVYNLRARLRTLAIPLGIRVLPER